MTQNRHRAWGIFLAAISIFFWGITFVCTKYLLNDFSSLEILFFRFIIAYIGLWIMHPRAEKIQAKDNILFFLAALSGLVLYQLFENIAIHFTNASNVSVIVSICPLFTAILTQLFFREKHLSFYFIAGFIVSITGVALVCLNGNTELKLNPKGDVLALLSGVCWGFYSMIISLINRRNYSSVCATRRSFFFAVLIMLPLSFAGYKIATAGGTGLGGDFARSLYFIADAKINAARFSNVMNWANLIFLGLVASGICFVSWNKACDILGTVKVNCSIYLIPVVTIIFAFFVLGEKITLLGGIGTLVTIAGLFLSEKKRSAKERQG